MSILRDHGVLFFLKNCWNKCLVNDDIVIYIVNLLVSTYMKKKRKKIPPPSEQFWGTQTIFSNDRILLLLGHETRWRIPLLHKGRTLDLLSQTYHMFGLRFEIFTFRQTTDIT